MSANVIHDLTVCSVFQVTPKVILAINPPGGFIYSLSSGKRIELPTSVSTSTPCHAFKLINGAVVPLYGATIAVDGDTTQYQIRLYGVYTLVRHPKIGVLAQWLFYDDDLKLVRAIDIANGDVVKVLEGASKKLVHVQGKLVTVYDADLKEVFKRNFLEYATIELTSPYIITSTPHRYVHIDDLVERDNVVELAHGNIAVIRKGTQCLLVDRNRAAECAVCFGENDRRYVLVPCGHSKFCSTCIESRKLVECPICRAKVTKCQKIYE